MAANSRFATGIHTLVLLATEPDTVQTSTDVARKLNTNPVVIRRLLASLQKAELITSHKGPSGGSKLSRPSKSISLGDVYRAVESGPLFHSPKLADAVGSQVARALVKVFAESQKAIEVELDQTSLSQLVKKIVKKPKED